MKIGGSGCTHQDTWTVSIHPLAFPRAYKYGSWAFPLKSFYIEIVLSRVNFPSNHRKCLAVEETVGVALAASVAAAVEGKDAAESLNLI